MGKFETHDYGGHVIVETDHKPLETMCQKYLATAPKILKRMLFTLQKYEFSVIHIPGTWQML